MIAPTPWIIFSGFIPPRTLAISPSMPIAMARGIKPFHSIRLAPSFDIATTNNPRPNAIPAIYLAPCFRASGSILPITHIAAAIIPTAAPSSNIDLPTPVMTLATSAFRNLPASTVRVISEAMRTPTVIAPLVNTSFGILPIAYIAATSTPTPIASCINVLDKG